MSYILNATTIKRPTSIEQQNSNQVAQVRTLSGAYNRDYFGTSKRVWTLHYTNCNVTQFNIINALYTNYIATGTPVSFSSDEANYTITSTTVHIDLIERSFHIRGSDYISDFDLILTEH